MVGQSLRIGDIIEIKGLDKRGAMVHEVWLPARIEDIGETSYGVLLLKANMCLRVPIHEYGRMWR